MSYLINLSTDRLLLKSLAESDVESFHQVWTDPGATLWSFHGPCKTLDESLSRLRQNALQTSASSLKRSYAVFLHTDTARANCLGIVSLFPWFRDGLFEPLLSMADAKAEATWEAAYLYKTEAWGKGIATEALMAAIGGLQREREGRETVLVAISNEANPGSGRVLTKAGFEYKGPLDLGKERIWIGGEWRDMTVLVWSRALIGAVDGGTSKVSSE